MLKKDLLFHILMSFNTGLKVYERKKSLSIVSSGDRTLNELLDGGFHQDLIYIIYGDLKKISKILLATAVNYCRTFTFNHRVALIDGNNRFNPYEVSKLAVSFRLNPTRVLENILISRAFMWEQMVELLENRLSELESVKMVIVSGFTRLWPNYEQMTFEGLLKAINGLKKIIPWLNPLIILTAPLHEYSRFRPVGGKYFAHFGHVLALITEEERFTEYILVQHPFLPEKKLVKFKPLKLKRGLKRPSRNATLDKWF